jgi:hypothetical protein
MLPEQHGISPAAKEIVKPGMTPCQQAHALNEKHLSSDAVKSMAHGLPERDSVKWATASAERVSNPAHKADLDAIHAAKAWAHNPTPETQKAAGLAAGKTDFQTPGAWAAQGAAWSGTGLTPHAVSGAVMLAAAQGGKPISAPGAAAPKLDALHLSQELSKPKMSALESPLLKKPGGLTTPEVPQAAIKGPDGLTLTHAQRGEMAKNCDPFLKLGCDIGHGRAA